MTNIKDRYRIIPCNGYKIIVQIGTGLFYIIGTGLKDGKTIMETGKVIFGLHTAEVKCWITSREHDEIKIYFGTKEDGSLKDRTRFYQHGITDIWINTVKGKEKFRYYIHIIINFARALDTGNYTMAPYTAESIKKAMAAVNKVLKTFPLSGRNNKITSWILVRFDYGFDIYEKHVDLLMQLMNRSLDLSNKAKKCSRIPVKGREQEDLMSESMRFGNASFVYNIYVKLKEIERNHKTITEEEKQEIQYLCRIERQTMPNSIKKLIPERKTGRLADPVVIEKIMKTIIDEIRIFFGTGNFCSWYYIKDKYYPEYKNDIEKIKQTMLLVTNSSLEKESGSYSKEIAGIFTNLCISPAGIKREYKVPYIDGIYNRIIKAYSRPKDKRRYSSFPVPHKISDGRYKSNITLYLANNGGNKKLISVAGKDLAEYEEKVFNKLRNTYLLNRMFLKSDNQDIQEAICKSADSILRFKKTIKTKEIMDDIEKFIDSYECDNMFHSE